METGEKRGMSRRRRVVIGAGGFAVAAAVVAVAWGTKRPETYDAAATPDGTPPTFAATWAGAPKKAAPRVVPSPDGRTLLVQGPTLPPRLVDVATGAESAVAGLRPDDMFLRPMSYDHFLPRPSGLRFAVDAAFDATGRYAILGATVAVGPPLLRNGRFNPLATPTVVDLHARRRLPCRAVDPPLGDVLEGGAESDDPRLSRFEADELRIAAYLAGAQTMFEGWGRTVVVAGGDGRPTTSSRPVAVGRLRFEPRRFQRRGASSDAPTPPATVEVGVYDPVRGRRTDLFSVTRPESSLARGAFAVDASARLVAHAEGRVVRLATFAAPNEPTKTLTDDVAFLGGDGAGFVTTHYGGAVRLWNGDVLRREHRLPDGVAPVRCATHGDVVLVGGGSDGGRGFAIRDDRAVVVEDLADLRELYALGEVVDRGEPVSVDGARAAFQLQGRRVRVVDFAAGTSAEIAGALDTLRGDFLAVRRLDATAVYDLRTTPPTERVTVPTDPLPIRRVEWKADGLWIASNEARVHDAGGTRLIERWLDETWTIYGDRRGKTSPTAEADAVADRIGGGRFLPDGDLLTRGPHGASTIRKMRGALTTQRAMRSPRGDLFVVPSHDLTRLRFGSFVDGLASHDGAPLVGPPRGELRDDDLQEGEVGGRAHLGARYAFVSDDVVAVCEPDGVFLRAVPSGRRLSRFGDPASALCLSPDGATLALLDDAGRMRLLRKS